MKGNNIMVVITEEEFTDLIHTVRCLVHDLNDDHGILKGCEWLAKHQNYIVRGNYETNNNHYHHSGSNGL